MTKHQTATRRNAGALTKRRFQVRSPNGTKNKQANGEGEREAEKGRGKSHPVPGARYFLAPLHSGLRVLHDAMLIVFQDTPCPLSDSVTSQRESPTALAPFGPYETVLRWAIHHNHPQGTMGDSTRKARMFCARVWIGT